MQVGEELTAERRQSQELQRQVWDQASASVGGGGSGPGTGRKWSGAGRHCSSGIANAMHSALSGAQNLQSVLGPTYTYPPIPTHLPHHVPTLGPPTHQPV